MTIEQIIAQLCNLREHCESMIDPVEQDCIWAYDVEALDNAIERMGGERRMSDLKIWLISGVIALAAIAVSVMYACLVVSSDRHKK
jgi:hypothetical protein